MQNQEMQERLLARLGDRVSVMSTNSSAHKMFSVPLVDVQMESPLVAGSDVCICVGECVLEVKRYEAELFLMFHHEEMLGTYRGEQVAIAPVLSYAERVA